MKRLTIYFIILGMISLTVNLWFYYEPSNVELELGNWLQFGNPTWLFGVMTLLTDSIYAVAFLVGGAAVWLVWRKHYIDAIFLSATLALLLLIEPIKGLLQRPRPVLEDVMLEQALGHSFPSGHAFTSLLLAGALAILFVYHRPGINRFFPIALACIYASIIGWTRIYLQAHYPSDVLGGFVIAAFCLLVLNELYIWLRKKLHQYKDIGTL